MEPISTSTPAAIKPAATFTRFPDLPKELRLQIFKWLVPEHRVIHVQVRKTHPHELFSPNPVPTALHICSESRREALKNFELYSGKISISPQIYINFSRDTIYVGPEHPPDCPEPGCFRSGSFHTIDEIIDIKKNRKKIRSIIVGHPHRGLNEVDRRWAWEDDITLLMAYCLGLKQVTLCSIDCDPAMVATSFQNDGFVQKSEKDNLVSIDNARTEFGCLLQDVLSICRDYGWRFLEEVELSICVVEEGQAPEVQERFALQQVDDDCDLYDVFPSYSP